MSFARFRSSGSEPLHPPDLEALDRFPDVRHQRSASYGVGATLIRQLEFT